MAGLKTQRRSARGPQSRRVEIGGLAAPSSGRFANTGNGPTLQPIDIGHRDYTALVDPDTAFWALTPREQLADVLAGKGRLLADYRRKSAKFAEEMHTLRFGLKPSAVYFNPTERCNLDCRYCYIPRTMRRDGQHMPADKLLDALSRLKAYFAAAANQEGGQSPFSQTAAKKGTVPKPQIVFHGAEPLLNREAVFAGIDAFANDFRFGVQTNATLLDDSAIDFLTGHDVSIGISLAGPTPGVAGRTRANWAGQGVFAQVVDAMNRLANSNYPGWSVIATVTGRNLKSLTRLVEFFHQHKAPTCMLNIVRCTLPPSRAVKPSDASAARHFLAAMDRTWKLYQQTGRKLTVANFANVLLAILAPTARRLMCDISPCGGGRCFFALAPNGDLFPCSEFIGLDRFRGGNLFRDEIAAVLDSEPFRMVTGRRVETIDPCRRCAIRHFCGSPCPAEAHEMNGGMEKTGAFCEFYEEQVRYAFRLIADNRHEAFLWDGWDKGMARTF